MRRMILIRWPLVAAAVLMAALSSGQGWKLRTKDGPGARRLAALAYDPIRKVHVLFGGSSNGQPLQDTWEYNGKTWTRIAVVGPSQRFNASEEYDPISKRILLFGGGTGVRLYSDTWGYDGKQWTLLSAAAPDQQLGVCKMTFDPTRNVMVRINSTSGETFEWDSDHWTQIFTGLQSRFGAQQDFDGNLNCVLREGNGDNSNQFNVINPDNQTFTLKPDGWHALGNVRGPVVGGGGMVYDAAIKRTVLFGGFETFASYYGEGGTLGIPSPGYYTFDGTAWTFYNDPTLAWRTGFSLTYDSARHTVVLFGGTTGGNVDLGDTWEWTPNPDFLGIFTEKPVLNSGESTTLLISLVEQAKVATTLELSTDTHLLSCPPTAVMQTGLDHVPVRLNAGIATADTPCHVFLTLGDRTVSVAIRILPAQLARISFPTDVAVGGSTFDGTIEMSGIAGPGGARVYLDSLGPVQIALSVLVPEGSKSAKFEVTSSRVSSPTTATIFATYGKAKRSATLTLEGGVR